MSVEEEEVSQVSEANRFLQEILPYSKKRGKLRAYKTSIADCTTIDS